MNYTLAPVAEFTVSNSLRGTFKVLLTAKYYWLSMLVPPTPNYKQQKSVHLFVTSVIKAAKTTFLVAWCILTN